jgi:hypothetical protein
MASITERIYKNGVKVYRVVIRRKDVPLLCLTFSSRKDAERWVDINEYNYIQSPEIFSDKLKELQLELKRSNEFSR